MLSCAGLSLAHRLHDISVEASAGQCWHILGANGAGKSSLLNVLAGLTLADAGQVHFLGLPLNNYDLCHLSQLRCYLQQGNEASFALSVFELIAFYAGDELAQTLMQNANTYEAQLAESVLTQLQAQTPEQTPERAQGLNISDLALCLGLAPLLTRNVQSLSGGEYQRVQLARSILQVWPAVQRGDAMILLDEPTQSLDIPYQEAVLNLCQDLAKLGNLVFIAHHEINQSYQYATHVLLLKQGGKLSFGRTKDVMTCESLSHLYDYPFAELSLSDNDKQTSIAAELLHKTDKYFIRKPI